MFTGIVEELGTVRAVGAGRLAIACRDVLEGLRTGDSVSVNGVCLTATRVDRDGFSADVMGETRTRSALGDLDAGAPVNLERALAAGARLGGHLVQGHVDAVAEVLAVEERDGDPGASPWTLMRIGLPPAVAPYVVEKGSITVDGASLTVTALQERSFAVGLIPHTLAVTVLGRRLPGDRVNLEADVVAKYVERLLQAGMATPYAQRAEGS
ncbi:MAG TPA: riboflavin synthase [Egibacteraceae bacterium]|nr:riboflavin synthase [Egibacteraceae bacterium]